MTILSTPTQDTGTELPRVLVLMATYNGSAWVCDQVRSIAAQRGVALTLAVRDDASTDDTLALVEAGFGTAGPLQILHSRCPGGSAAKNFFRLIQDVNVSGHDFVALADQDDIWEPAKLARAVQCLNGSGAVGYSAAVRAFWPDGRTALLTQNRTPTLADYLYEGGGQGCTYLMRASTVAQLQTMLAAHQSRLDVLHYHDWTLYALCRAQGLTWFIDDWACLQYRQHSSNDTGARSGLANIGKRLALLRSGWYGAQIDAVARLCVAAAGESATGAVNYLRCSSAARAGWPGRLRLCVYMLRHGRRRTSDRLVMAWAALCGHLTRDDSPAH